VLWIVINIDRNEVEEESIIVFIAKLSRVLSLSHLLSIFTSNSKRRRVVCDVDQWSPMTAPSVERRRTDRMGVSTSPPLHILDEQTQLMFSTASTVVVLHPSSVSATLGAHALPKVLTSLLLRTVLTQTAPSPQSFSTNVSRCSAEKGS